MVAGPGKGWVGIGGSILAYVLAMHASFHFWRRYAAADTSDVTAAMERGLTRAA